MSLWPVTIATLIAALAWLFQRAWERQEFKQESYKKILDYMPAFLINSHDPNGVDGAVNEMRSLLLFAPDYVIGAAEDFLTSLESGGTSTVAEQKLSELILAMRSDCSFAAALRPHFWSTKLKSTGLATKTATRRRS